MADTPRTPPSKSQPQLSPDTELIQRFTSMSEYRTGDLSLGRQAVLKDVRRYLQVPHDTLIRSVFGPPPSNVSEIRRNLEDYRVLNVAPDGTTSQWAALKVEPARSSASESETFQPLVDIFEKIFSQIPDCNVFFDAKPSTTPLSERQDTARPDAYVTLERPAANGNVDPAANGIHWFDIAIPFEFKKSNELHSRRDNEQKIIWSLHSIMREDPLRRFALGITIENTSLRLWCGSRALLAVSEPINFLTSIDDVISLVYLIGNATSVQLGWDPTVQRIHVANEIQYEFQICNQVFTTTRSLATYGADAMVSRGTRVYKARGADGKIVVIKDSWRDEDRVPEGAILENIFKDIRKASGEEAEAEAKRYCIAVQSYEDVIICGEIDKTFKLGEEEADSCLKWHYIVVDSKLSERRHLPSVGLVPDSEQLPTGYTRRLRIPNTEVCVPRKVHARIVFREVGIPLVDVTHLTNSLTCLSGSQRALYHLHKAGWVHRDFSVTNVLWVEADDGQCIGKLTDFEYAKRVDSTVSHDVRTGTVHFMAVEVDSQVYSFLPEESTPYPPGSEPPFRMNYLHDLESLWWASIWILFRHTDKKSPPEDPDGQLWYFNEAFPPINKQPRQHFFNTAQRRGQARQTLSHTYRDACEKIVFLPHHLRSHYREVEKNYPLIDLPDSIREAAHKQVSDAYSNAIESLRDSDIELVPLTRKRDSSNLPTQQAKKKARRDSS